MEHVQVSMHVLMLVILFAILDIVYVRVIWYGMLWVQIAATAHLVRLGTLF